MKFKVGDRVRMSPTWTGDNHWRRYTWYVCPAPACSCFPLWIDNGEDALYGAEHEFELMGRGLVDPKNRSRVYAGPSWGC